MTLTKKDLDKCPVCEAFVNLAEEAACTLLKQVNPNLDMNACKKLLRMKLEGKSAEEIAKNLNVPVNTLIKIMGESVRIAEQALNEARKGK